MDDLESKFVPVVFEENQFLPEGVNQEVLLDNKWSILNFQNNL